MFKLFRHRNLFLRANIGVAGTGCSSLSSSARAAVKQMPARPSVDEADLDEAFLKGSGPGGQKINKTSSAVQLKHRPTGIVIKSQATRSRTQNRKIARLLLAERLEEMEKGPESRRGVKAAVASKRKASKTKKAKRKYKKLDGEKEASDLQEGEEQEDPEEADPSGKDLGNVGVELGNDSSDGVPSSRR